MSTIRHRGSNGFPHSTSSFSAAGYDKDATRERIAADLAAFDKAGGRIEVLGVTPLRRKAEKTVSAVMGTRVSTDKPDPNRRK